VTRQKENTVYKSIREFELSDTTSDAVLKDERITVEKKDKIITPRRSAYWNNEKKQGIYE